MFGTILADQARLTPAQEQRYKACYCGLCRTLQKEYGLLSRLTLSYDMTFLILLLSSLYEPEQTVGEKRCIIHPAKPRPFWQNRFTSYAAAMNVALAYYKAMDDWQDDRNVLGIVQAKLLSSGIKKAEKAHPEKCHEIRRCLQMLKDLEEKRVSDPDAAAACFGRLTGSLFVFDQTDHWAATLRRLGDALGRFIYLSDALIDLKEDLRKNRFNPLTQMVRPGSEEDFLPALRLTIGDCAAELERLPLLQDLDILRNIIYSGVWIPYTAHQKKKEKE